MELGVEVASIIVVGDGNDAGKVMTGEGDAKGTTLVSGGADSSGVHPEMVKMKKTMQIKKSNGRFIILLKSSSWCRSPGGM
jgi:hypothetical protein